jgi:hypothetical protein
MTVARQLAKRIMRGLGPIPAKVRPLLQAELERAVPAAAAVLALADRFDKRNGGILAINGAFRSPPPLSEAEWLQLFDLFASGRMRPFHSKPELTRRRRFRSSNRPASGRIIRLLSSPQSTSLPLPP